MAALFGDRLLPPIEVTLYHWLAFSAFVVVMLVLDLGVFHRESRESTLREAGMWTAIWAVLALSFNGVILWWQGMQPAVNFLTGYLIEWSLSMDNVFVFAVIFAYFRVPPKYQYRVLFWGILGAVVMRLTFILLGAALIQRFHVTMVVLGVFLIYTGLKLAFSGDSELHPERTIVLRMARKILPVSRGEHGNHFFVKENGKWHVTPLFLVLLVVESTDVMFAVDSVPAIFAITDDRFIIFTSNVFAILGLRALYFLLAGVMDLFKYLKFGLSAILAFVGCKMVGQFFFEEQFKIWMPPWASLIVVVSLLAISITASILAKRREDAAPQTESPPAPVETAPLPDATSTPPKSRAPGP